MPKSLNSEIPSKCAALGIIEGFYGKPWGWGERHQTVEWMAQKKMDFYFYCPKADRYLREKWHQDWPQEEIRQLKALRSNCQNLQIDFGIGLSPFEVYKNWNEQTKQLLIQKIQQINKISPDWLGILFDDMNGDYDLMAKIQIEIGKLAKEYSSASKILICPTWYTKDPEIRALFGEIPSNYWKELGDGLPAEIEIFWTGEKVCSTSYSQIHLKEMMETFGRKVFIWDNYPVNDGVRMAPFLHLQPSPRPSWLNDWVAGIGFNPMVECGLSRIPIAGMIDELRGQCLDLETLLHQECGTDLAPLLWRDVDMFYNRGVGHHDKDLTLNRSRRIFSSNYWNLLSPEEKLSIQNWQLAFEKKFSQALNQHEKLSLIEQYQKIESALANEVVAWLKGCFDFDPNCLT